MRNTVEESFYSAKRSFVFFFFFIKDTGCLLSKTELLKVSPRKRGKEVRIILRHDSIT